MNISSLLHTNSAFLNALEINPPRNVWAERLSNGLTLYYEHRQDPNSTSPFLFIRVAVKAGFNVETQEEQGISHLLEHVLFWGTKSFPREKMEELLQDYGCSLQVDSNARTDFDRTVYLFDRISGKKASPLLNLLIMKRLLLESRLLNFII
jgi:predicted Zn-dependent peptidase